MLVRKSFSALSFAILIALLVSTVVYAGLYIGPGSTVGGVNVGWAHWIQIGSTSFQDRADSTAASNISRIGGVTFASREWCGTVIRNSLNHGGWVKYNSSSANLYGGLTWGPRCTNQKAGTAAQHDFSQGGQTYQPYFYATEPRP